jgi:putative ABC transport system permease protein
MKLAPRWRKILQDLWGNKIRTVLVILSIAVGVFAVGFVSGSFNIIMGDMDKDYQSSNPHSAIIYCEPFDESFVESLRNIPEIADLQGRRSIAAQVKDKSGKTIAMSITALPEDGKQTIDKIFILDSKYPVSLARQNSYHYISLEQTGAQALGVQPGDILNVEIQGVKTRELLVTSIVHDPGNPSYLFSNQVAAYIDKSTMQWLSGSNDLTQLFFTVQENKTDEEHVKRVAGTVSDKISKSGREVYGSFVYRPGQHFAADTTSALGALMSFLGAFSVLLSGFLVINTINALLAQHTRQIGIMKSIGGTTSQIITMYLVMVLAFGLLAFLIAAPLAAAAGYVVARGIGSYLNFHVAGFRIPTSTLLLELAVAILIPLVSALFPVFKGTRISVREAISDYGLSGQKAAVTFFDRIVDRLHNLPRPQIISLKNTFRRKTRLFLTLSTLTLAGAIFISVLNVQASFIKEIDQTIGYILSDVNIAFSRPHRIQKLQSIAYSVPGVVMVEGWGAASAEMLHSKGADTSTEITILAPPAQSTLIKPVLSAGRWLRPDDENSIVVGNHLLRVRPDINVGSQVILKIKGKEYKWNVVGIYHMAGNALTPIVYANFEYIARLQNTVDMIDNIRVVTTDKTARGQQLVANALKAGFETAGIQAVEVLTGSEIIQQNATAINLLIYFLLLMAVLIAFVGGLGLMGTMSMNVLERTREIGVMRAIGARDVEVFNLVIQEGILIGMISWTIGIVIAVPITLLLDYVVGIAFITTPMKFIYSMNGIIIWLALVIVISYFSSLLPARNATRLTIREILAYE